MWSLREIRGVKGELASLCNVNYDDEGDDLANASLLTNRKFTNSPNPRLKERVNKDKKTPTRQLRNQRLQLSGVKSNKNKEKEKSPRKEKENEENKEVINITDESRVVVELDSKKDNKRNKMDDLDKSGEPDKKKRKLSIKSKKENKGRKNKQRNKSFTLGV